MTTKRYETVALIDPSLSDEEVGKLVRKLETSLIVKLKGKLLKNESMGRRKLAYPVKKKTDASYVKLEVEFDAPALAEYEHNLRLEPKILRELTVRV